MNLRYNDLNVGQDTALRAIQSQHCLPSRMDSCPLKVPNAIYCKIPKPRLVKKHVEGGAELGPSYSEEELYK